MPPSSRFFIFLINFPVVLLFRMSHKARLNLISQGDPPPPPLRSSLYSQIFLPNFIPVVSYLAEVLSRWNGSVGRGKLTFFFFLLLFYLFIYFSWFGGVNISSQTLEPPSLNSLTFDHMAAQPQTPRTNSFQKSSWKITLAVSMDDQGQAVLLNSPVFP